MKRLACFTLLILAMAVTSAFAATANPSPASPGYTPMVIKFSGYTASRTGVVSWKAPAGYVVKSASVTVRAVGGTNPTMKIRGKDGAFVRYTGTINSATTKDLTLTATPYITDETQQSIDIVTGGTSPNFSDITLFLFLKRR
jgi:hypothetical protein